MKRLVRIRLENLTKRFGKVTAIKDVNLEVRSGEFFVLVGPNGCGKTTLLRLIAGLIKPDNGKIYFEDEPVNDVKPRDRGVRMVFQNYALFPHMKVFDEKRFSNLSFSMRIRKYLSERIRSVTEKIADQVGIEKELFHRKPHQLSAGQKQKVAVGRSMTIPPKLFLMDEPLSNLDPPSRVQAMKEIRRIHQESKTTTIYVTQNLIEAMSMADRMAVMKEGTIQQVGAPEQVRKHPKNNFVADFIKYYDYTYHLQTLKTSNT